MVVLVVHLWARPGRENEFRTYEDAALTIFRRHGGEVLEVLHPDTTLSTAPVPHEIHRLRIASLEAWGRFQGDEKLRSLAPQRAACIAQTQLFFCRAA